jgi:hypothetical protein
MHEDFYSGVFAAIYCTSNRNGLFFRGVFAPRGRVCGFSAGASMHWTGQLSFFFGGCQRRLKSEAG